MDKGSLVLTTDGVPSFTYNSVDCTKITIRNESSISATGKLTLSECGEVTLLGVGQFEIDLVTDDLNELKLNQYLGTKPSDTFLLLQAGNNLNDKFKELVICLVDQASSVTADSTPPKVSDNGFNSFDLNSGKFSIQFTEPMDVSTIVVPNTLFFEYFKDIANPETDIFEVQNEICSSPTCKDGTTVNFTLHSDDLNRLKLTSRVCTSAADCWLSINGSFISDMAGNKIEPLPDETRTDVRYPLEFTDDTSSPILSQFELNMSSLLLTLYFDEPIDVSTIMFSEITLQGKSSVDPTETSSYYNLTGGTTDSSSGTVIEVKISDTDALEIQSRPEVATAKANTYISFTSEAFHDVSYLKNKVKPLLMGSAVQVTEFIPDSAPPEVKTFSLDLDANTLTLTFTEAVLVDSVNVQKLLIVSSPDSDEVRQITGGDIHPTLLAASSTITFILTNEDVTYLKVSDALAVNASNTFLASLAGLANDTNSVSSNALPVANAISINQFVKDVTSPEARGFSLDMNIGKLVITFDDVVVGSSFDVNGITVQNGEYRKPLEWHTLSSQSSNNSVGDGFIIEVQIGMADLNRIKQIRTLATSLTSSYVTMTAMLVDDPYGEDLIAITDGKSNWCYTV